MLEETIFKECIQVGMNKVVACGGKSENVNGF